MADQGKITDIGTPFINQLLAEFSICVVQEYNCSGAHPMYVAVPQLAAGWFQRQKRLGIA
jgi:hypothetical protein